jgi:hypothetical protein
MTTINDTVATALRNTNLAGYVQQAQPVVNALVEREQVIYTGLVEAGVALGASKAQVEQALNGLGVHAPAAPAAAENAEGGDIAATLREINAKLTSLTNFAQANGYRG